MITSTLLLLLLHGTKRKNKKKLKKCSNSSCFIRRQVGRQVIYGTVEESKECNIMEQSKRICIYAHARNDPSYHIHQLVSEREKCFHCSLFTETYIQHYRSFMFYKMYLVVSIRIYVRTLCMRREVYFNNLKSLRRNEKKKNFVSEFNSKLHLKQFCKRANKLKNKKKIKEEIVTVIDLFCNDSIYLYDFLLMVVMWIQSMFHT